MIRVCEDSVVAIYPANQSGFSIAASKHSATAWGHLISDLTDDGPAFGANLCLTHAYCSQVHITEYWVWHGLLSAETELLHPKRMPNAFQL